MADLSVRDVAHRARTSDRTVRRWIAEHKLTATRTADGWTVDEADLDAMMDGRPSAQWPRGRTDSESPPVADGRPDGRTSEAPYLADLVRQLAERAEASAAAAAMWQARAELLAEQLERAQLALAAPAPTMPEIAPGSPPANAASETPETPPVPPARRPWWRWWRAS